MSKARPILFSGPMVRALLDGRKTQTRRVIKPQPLSVGHYADLRYSEAFNDHNERIYCPYGQPGDLLWVRESYATDSQVDSIKPSELSLGEPIHYQADEAWRITGCHPISKGKIRPNIFLMKWMSRLTLEITDVRVERLREITESDAIAEGLSGERFYTHPTEGPTRDTGGMVAIHRFKDLWQAINGKESWADNPWVWVIEFKVHQKNVLEMTNA